MLSIRCKRRRLADFFVMVLRRRGVFADVDARRQAALSGSRPGLRRWRGLWYGCRCRLYGGRFRLCG
jgi:hypothetical protein